MVIVSKQLTIPSTEKQLSDYAEGDVIKILENGTPVEFYVTKHNYESGLNGDGRTLVVRKDCYNNRNWNGRTAIYSNSDIDNWLNNTYKNILDINIRSLIDTTKIYYSPSTHSGVSTLERSIFILSHTELGFNHSYANVEGSVLPIVGMLQAVYMNGNLNSQWTRTPHKGNSNMAWYISDYASDGATYCYSSQGARPVFTLPSTTKFDSNNNVIIG